MPAVSQSRQPSARTGPDVPTSAADLVIIFALLTVVVPALLTVVVPLPPTASRRRLQVRFLRLVPRGRRAA